MLTETGREGRGEQEGGRQALAGSEGNRISSLLFLHDLRSRNQDPVQISGVSPRRRVKQNESTETCEKPRLLTRKGREGRRCAHRRSPTESAGRRQVVAAGSIRGPALQHRRGSQPFTDHLTGPCEDWQRVML